MGISLSLLVPTLGERPAELQRLLDSLAEQTYKNIEVVIISQGNHQIIANQCEVYQNSLTIKHLRSDIKGLSLARNMGLREQLGDIVILSDDDCWYPADAMQSIADTFKSQPEADILLTQIFDPIDNVPYKNYGKNAKRLTKATELLSRSSIELAFRKDDSILFDELFGLGATYASGEENDFLIRYLKAKKVIVYQPMITVYHQIKKTQSSQKQLIAKGAFYAKHFGFFVSNIVLLRDLVKKKQNNYKWFWKGYYDYRKRKRLLSERKK